MDASALLGEIRLVPVVTIEDSGTAVALAETLLAAGVGAIEVTLRSPQALASIENIAEAVPDLLLGAGSIRHAGQIDEVVSAGARFAVSPGTSQCLLRAVAECDLPFIPGASTASEMIVLLEQGYRLQKFFPAELCGGIRKIRALSAPLPEVRFFPTGGISAALAPEYLAVEAVACIGGSWFVDAGHLAARNFQAIGKLARGAMKIVGG